MSAAPRQEKRPSVLIRAAFPSEIEGFDSLAELALDMRSSWNHATDGVWRKLNPALWELTHNPWMILQTVSRDQIERVLADPAFRRNGAVNGVSRLHGKVSRHLFDPNALTLGFARRFATYKRPNLLLHDPERRRSPAFFLDIGGGDADWLAADW